MRALAAPLVQAVESQSQQVLVVQHLVMLAICLLLVPMLSAVERVVPSPSKVATVQRRSVATSLFLLVLLAQVLLALQSDLLRVPQIRASVDQSLDSRVLVRALPLEVLSN